MPPNTRYTEPTAGPPADRMLSATARVGGLVTPSLGGGHLCKLTVLEEATAPNARGAQLVFCKTATSTRFYGGETARETYPDPFPPVGSAIKTQTRPACPQHSDRQAQARSRGCRPQRTEDIVPDKPGIGRWLEPGSRGRRIPFVRLSGVADRRGHPSAWQRAVWSQPAPHEHGEPPTGLGCCTSDARL